MSSPRFKVIEGSGPVASSGLLETKLHPPRSRPKTVRRERLVQHGGEVSEYRLILVSAPAGFGKSTLVSTWAAESGSPVAWLSLDEGDANSERFLRYLVGSIQVARPSTGTETLAMLDLPALPPPDVLLTPLINELSGRERLTIVLDDYHAVSESPVDSLVSFLVDNVPANVTIVIATRTDPAVPLSKLRARGEALELRAEDLRFTPEEAATFLNETMGLDLSGNEVGLVEERTEGWAAGLQLAALSLRGREDRGEFLATFSGSNRLVIDYLMDEVLTHMSDDLREFVLRISILPRFCAPLCDALTRSSSSSANLERLESENLFLIALDDTRSWYRFHHLFGDLVRRQLEATSSPDDRAELHARASDWLADNGLPEEALEQACQAGSKERALRILETAGRREMMSGNIGRLARWFERVPLEWLEDDLTLLFNYATALYGTLRLKEFMPIMNAFAQIATRRDDPQADLYLRTLKVLLDTVSLPAAETLARGREFIESLPESEHNVRAIIGITLGLSALEASTLDESMTWLEGARRSSLANNNPLLTLVATSFIGWGHYVVGHLHDAEKAWDEALAIGMESGGVRNPAASVALAGRAGVSLDRYRLDEARAQALEAIEAGRVGVGSGRVHALIHLAWIELCAGNPAAARAAEKEVDEFLRGAGGERGIAYVEVMGIRLEIEAARQEQKALSPSTLKSMLTKLSRFDDSDPTFDVPGETRQVLPLTIALTHVMSGNHREAIEVLDRTIEMVRRDDLRRDLCEALLLRAIAARALRLEGEARASVAEAFAIAADEGFVSTFARYRNELPDLFRLFDPTDASGLFAEPIRELVARPASRRVGLLSDREIEILSEIARGSSNAEAAQKLFISPQTVKKHLENVYAKLGVGNRTEAVDVARREGLL